MNVRWNERPEAAGNAFGYLAQQARTAEAAARFGLVEDPHADVFVNCRTPISFRPSKRRGDANVLYTNWEADRLSPAQQVWANQADLIVTISSWCAEIFRRELLPTIPVEYVHLGLDRIHSPVRRHAPGRRPFRWLWVGAESARKGWQLIVGQRDASQKKDIVIDPGGVWWTHGFARRDDVELYVKMSTYGTEEVRTLGNVTFDTRRISDIEMRDLYRSAHGFLFPSYGEGWGLTLAEAMASGLPSLYTRWGGVLDFVPAADHAAHRPLPHEMIRVTDRGEQRYGVEVEVPQARIDLMALQMADLMDDYQRARREAEGYGWEIYRRLTWERTGRDFVRALERHVPAILERKRALAPLVEIGEAQWEAA